VGIVVGVGEDCQVVKEGDMVVFAKYSGTDFKPYMQEELCEKYKACVIMNEEDILCFVQQENGKNGQEAERA